MNFHQLYVVLYWPDRTGFRICPGRHLVYSSLWINIVSILAMFEISRAVDTAPDEVLISEEQFTNTTVRYSRLLKLIDQQADTNCLPVGQRCSSVQSSHTLRRKGFSWDWTSDETSFIGMLEILSSCPSTTFDSNNLCKSSPSLLSSSRHVLRTFQHTSFPIHRKSVRRGYDSSVFHIQ